MTRARLVVLSALVFALVASCGAGGPDPARVVPPAVKAGCILIRAITQDGRADEVCATAEDLAPLLGELLAEHQKNVDAGAKPAEPIVSFSIAPPARPRPRRRCVQWVGLSALEDGGPEAGGDGGR